jgi:hypothetical protein
MSVPGECSVISIRTVRAKPVPCWTEHFTAVLLCHEVVEQVVEPTMTVGVRPDVSTKLNPLNVTELPVLSGIYLLYIFVL